MNAIREFDLELLEDYLDDALSPAQVEHVVRRLAEEPELALAMHELRAARVLRAAVWRSSEPTVREAADLADRVSATVQQADRDRRVWRGMRLASGVAAGVAVFIAGWLIRGPVLPPAKVARLAGPAPLALRSALPVAQPAASAFHVALLDSRGNVIPVQKFAQADDAREFARDLMTFEDRRQDAQQGSAMLVSDRF